MKILHAADLHLCTPFLGRRDDQVAQLKDALLQIPEQLAELCKTRNCDLVLLCGDLFDGPSDADSVRILKNALEEMGVPVFISPGNHDFCTPTSPYLTEKWPENVHIFTDPAMDSIALPALDCRVYGAGYHSMDCGPLLENFHSEGTERHHIGILHGDPMQTNSPYCPVTQAQVAASGFSYLALGHIHKAGSFTAGNTLCAWPGCPMGRGYDELGEKGVYIVTLEEETTFEFVSLATPRFYDLETEIQTSPQDAAAALLPAVGNMDFYRITFVGEATPFDAASLAFPQFPNLELRDRTVAPTDLWGSIGEDSLEGTYFRLLHDAMVEDEAIATLAAKISRRILDSQEVVLP